jgi:hypothetical protein
MRISTQPALPANGKATIAEAKPLFRNILPASPLRLKILPGSRHISGPQVAENRYFTDKRHEK